jgi:hypothetical protein
LTCQLQSAERVAAGLLIKSHFYPGAHFFDDPGPDLVETRNVK